MNKEMYLNLQQSNQGQLIYIYYKEKFDEKKHRPLLQFQELMHYLQMVSNIQVILEIICQYYDSKFKITRIFNKEGVLIHVI